MKVFGIVAAAFLMAGVGAFRPHVPLVARQATTTMFHGAPVAAPAAPARSRERSGAGGLVMMPIGVPKVRAFLLYVSYLYVERRRATAVAPAAKYPKLL